MNEILEAMRARRSYRKYKPDMVPDALIEQVIEAGLFAASGMGKQATKIIAITNKQIRDELSELNRTAGPAAWPEDFDPFYGAPVVLIVLGSKSVPFSVYDGSLVMGNLMLAAHALGLGSCWIHRAKEEFEGEYGKALLKKLGIEGEWEGIGHCILGYPDGGTPAAARRLDNRVHWIK